MEKIKELASDNVLLSAYLLLQEAKELKRSLALELDMARDRRLAQEKEFGEQLARMDETIEQLRALYQINLRVLNIINAPAKVGEKDEADFITRFTQ